MTITPSELEIMNQAADLLDLICDAAHVGLTTSQRAEAASAIETRLIELRRQWAGPVQAVGRQLPKGGAL